MTKSTADNNGPGTSGGNFDNARTTTGICKTEAGIGFGLAVSRGYVFDRDVLLGALSLDTFKGCSIRDVTQPATNRDKYAMNGVVGVQESGSIWVAPSVPVAMDDPVHFDPSTGVFSNTGGLGPILGARWKTSCDAGGTALLNLPKFLQPSPRSNYDIVSALGSDLIEYWDAARADTLSVMTDSTYTNAVSSWLGLVRGSNLAMSTPNLKPIYSPTGLGGGPCLTFDGVRQFMKCVDADLMSVLPAGANPCEIWVLCSQDVAAADGTTRHAVGYANSSVVNGRSVARLAVGGVNRARVYAGTGAAATTATDTHVDLSGVHVIRGVIGSTQVAAEVDGEAQVTAAVVPVTSTPALLTAGSIPALAASNWWQGKIAAILITKPLSSDKASALHAYLG